MIIISLAIAGLIFFGFYKWYDPNDLLFLIGTTAISFILLAAATSVSYPETPRTGVMIKVVSSVFFLIILPADILMAAFKMSDTTFIITNGLALCIWATTVYAIGRARQ